MSTGKGSPFLKITILNEQGEALSTAPSQEEQPPSYSYMQRPWGRPQHDSTPPRLSTFTKQIIPTLCDKLKRFKRNQLVTEWFPCIGNSRRREL